LRRLQYADFSISYEQGFEELLKTLGIEKRAKGDIEKKEESNTAIVTEKTIHVKAEKTVPVADNVEEMEDAYSKISTSQIGTEIQKDEIKKNPRIKNSFKIIISILLVVATYFIYQNMTRKTYKKSSSGLTRYDSIITAQLKIDSGIMLGNKRIITEGFQNLSSFSDKGYNNSRFFHYLAKANDALGNFSAAIANYSQAIDLNRLDTTLYLGRADIYLRNKDTILGYRDCQSAIDLGCRSAEYLRIKYQTKAITEKIKEGSRKMDSLDKLSKEALKNIHQ
jgi:tetratricopeptide (TPR) repeat protein